MSRSPQHRVADDRCGGERLRLDNLINGCMIPVKMGIQANGQGLGMPACAGMMALLDVSKAM